MRTSVQFRQPVQPHFEEQAAPRQMGDHLSALAENLQLIEANASVIDKNVKVIQSIMRSTDNAELRAHLLGQIKYMHDQLSLVSLGLVCARQSMEKA